MRPPAGRQDMPRPLQMLGNTHPVAFFALHRTPRFLSPQARACGIYGACGSSRAKLIQLFAALHREPS